MKTSTISLYQTVVGTLAAFAAVACWAQAAAPPQSYSYESSSGTGFFLNADLGPAILQDFNSTRFGPSGHFSSDPGLRFDVAPGFDFLKIGALTLGADAETGAIYNYINRIKLNGTDTGLRADYYQVPLLANLELKLHATSFITPYLDLGGGGDFSAASLRHHYYYVVPDEQRSTSDRVDPAAQGGAGVRFRLNSNMQLGIAYKYLADFGSGGTANTATHSILASFNWKF